MRLRVNQIVVKLEYTPDDVLHAIARKLGALEQNLSEIEVLRRSLDARHKDRLPHYVLSAEVTYSGDTPPTLAPGQVGIAPPPESVPKPRSAKPRAVRPFVVGAGPAGLMAALTLAEAGQRPVLIERGAEIETRKLQVETFWRQGLLNPESNVLYGEGGAGLFSDGKLTARTKNRPAVRRFFEVLVEHGAPSDILIDAEPHIGSDVLSQIMPALRDRITELGGEVRFHARLEDVLIEDGALRGVKISGEDVRTDRCFLATGHSARDVYRMLAERNIAMAVKPFAVGVRMELPQARIDRSQYGRWASHPSLGSASFRLSRKGGGHVRSCYSFCMCPGGLVMACASSEGMLTTNGMSYSGRSKPLGNAAIVVPVGPDDFPEVAGNPALAGIAYQERLERAAFIAGGSDFTLPAQRLTDFLDAAHATPPPAERSCSRVVAADLNALLPDVVAQTLRSALPKMLRELSNAKLEEILLYGLETRSSSPVRILRDPETLESASVRGLSPIGEGSGHAGGIVSSAIDGMVAATHAIAPASQAMRHA